MNIDERLRKMKPSDTPLLVVGYIILGIMLLLSSTSVAAYDENNERFCLAQNIYFEAGNQPLAGRIAVGLVTLNRMNDVQFPDTVCDVVYQAKMYTNWKGNEMPRLHQCQFNWYCDGKSDEPKDSTTWMESIKIADDLLTFDVHDFTDGAMWYHADWAWPYWADHLEHVVTIEDHVFYK